MVGFRDKRQYPRICISFPVECFPLPQRNYFYTVSKNLSVGGIAVISAVLLPYEMPIKININLVDEILSFKSRIAWCRKSGRVERYIAGIEFLEPTATKRNRIEHFFHTIGSSGY